MPPNDDVMSYGSLTTNVYTFNLTILDLVGPNRENLVPNPLAELSLDNQLYI